MRTFTPALLGSSSFHEIQRAQALAVRGERILAVGREADILKLKGPATVVVDLKGRFTMPGFNDAHMHLTNAGFKKLTVDLTGTKSMEEFRERIRQRVETAARWTGLSDRGGTRLCGRGN